MNFKKFNPSYTAVELSTYLEDMRVNGISFKYTMVFTKLGERTYYKTIKDGSGNDIVIYSHSGYETKSVRQLFLSSPPPLAPEEFFVFTAIRLIKFFLPKISSITTLQ